ncbi:hypothetical protein SAMN05216282_10773 [Cryobacterium psychrotolerans]|uniref:Uncharacterized protein n=1 Tax=Cryobacterium psychrotolerans TaxID=386301 RepID=A0A1G9CJJ6_9MICO|nr:MULTISPECIES: DUF2304 domain-containing protein [Cryobacterium]TFD45090.1 DUF2304 domain-containing protein [Cryobacterium sp. TMT1-2-1]TFD84268.1 DUF2304 domain-containing protein [Cryobacterium psychrotolerans]SDK51595.1 hypothetical protein SAMN05216282_10773 [Cryobacterium psychrotolerans]
MSTATYILGIVSALIALFTVVELLRRRRLRERHAVWWFVAALLALVLGIFPATLTALADLLGVEVPTNLVFFVSIVILFLVSLQHSSELTGLEDKTRVLAEESALQKVRLERLEGLQERPSGDFRPEP